MLFRDANFPRKVPIMSNTAKRIRPAQSSPKPITAVEPKPATGQPLPYLSRTHELITDAVAELLTHGGHTDDINLLTYCTMAHTRRRTLGRLVEDPAKLGKLIQEFIESDMGDWKTDLALAWRQNKRAEPPAFVPATVTDRIRANVREDLIDQFKDFMSQASPEEQRFLYEVFGNFDSRHHCAEHGSDEIFLGDAFTFAIERSQCYMKVPEHLIDKVQAYIDALKAIEPSEKAVAA
jgi:hypothetical protein